MANTIKDEMVVSESFLPKGIPYDRDLDRGWAWVILVASFTSTAIIYGFFMSSSGIYFVAFLDTFGHSRSTTSWVITSLFVSAHVQGLISGVMLSKYGARKTMASGTLLVSGSLALSFFADSILHLIISFAVCGIGIGFIMSSSLAAIAMYFNKYLNAATGVICSGAGLGILFMGNEAEWSIETFGWRGSMLFQSGIILQILICAALVFPVSLPSINKPQRRQQECGSQITILRDARLQAMMVSFILFYGAISTLLMILKDAFLSHNFETSYETIITYFGTANIVGRLAAGFCSQYFPQPPVHYFAASTLTALTSCMFIFAHHNQWLYILATALLGFLCGYQAVVQALSLSYLFGREHMAILWSYCLFTAVVSLLGLLPLAGWMIDQTGSYVGTFLMSAVGFFASGLAAIISYWLHQRRLATTTT